MMSIQYYIRHHFSIKFIQARFNAQISFAVIWCDSHDIAIVFICVFNSNFNSGGRADSNQYPFLPCKFPEVFVSVLVRYPFYSVKYANIQYLRDESRSNSLYFVRPVLPIPQNARVLRLDRDHLHIWVFLFEHPSHSRNSTSRSHTTNEVFWLNLELIQLTNEFWTSFQNVGPRI
ncbi:Hypothetical_protein [Hexamita inflata]|uniref:Hypothetical_protein n=1 Tax=Hexamita inflata TaxID=28002 RepID=A0ABP1JAW1_9EUKA